MAIGWNLWVWLPCIMRLVGGVVRRYIDILINFPYSTCICSFFGSSIPTSLFIFYKNKNKNAKCRFVTLCGAYVNCAIMAILYTHSIGNQP